MIKNKKLAQKKFLETSAVAFFSQGGRQLVFPFSPGLLRPPGTVLGYEAILAWRSHWELQIIG